MKKLFFFAATLCGAMAMNAASFTGFDGRDGTLGTQIHDNNLIQNQVNCSLDETDTEAHKYSIKNVTGGTPTTFTMGGITFTASDANADKELWKTYGTYIQANGARRTITIPTTAGEKVDIYVQDALTGVKVEGLATTTFDFVSSGSEKTIANTLTATGTSIVIYSNGTDESSAKKAKIQAIIPNTGTGLMDAAAAPAQVKKIVKDGKMFILKDGKEISVLGF